MHTNADSLTSAIGPRVVGADRRNRHHLRELCDEVLASYRVARDRDLFDDGERSEAKALLARILPGTPRTL
jgi:hypothetical protein